MTFPNLRNPDLFPTFASIPLFGSPAPDSEYPPIYYLLAQIHENMTLSSTPTFICKDITSSSFAVKILINTEISDFRYKRFKKGFTIAIRGATKKGSEEGKQGFVEVGEGDVLIIPTSLEKLLSISQKTYQTLQSSKLIESASCQACGTPKQLDQLSRCKGCESAWYCNKECQTKGWSEKGHKSDCKVLKVLQEMS